MLNCLCGGTVFIRPRHCHRRSGRPLPTCGQSILVGEGGTGRGCSPRGTSNCHYGKGYPCSRTGVNGVGKAKV